MQNMTDGETGPQAGNLVALDAMKGVERWLLWQEVPQLDRKPLKVPYYVNGNKRGPPTDTSDDSALLASYTEAKMTLAKLGKGWGLGFALGPDATGGYWQGIDLDDIEVNGLSDIANRWGRGDLHDWG